LTPPEAVDVVAQSTDAPLPLKIYGQPRSYIKELENPISVKAGINGYKVRGPEDSAIFAFMQAYYQAERTSPPVDKNIASPVQAMMMMTSQVVTKRISAEGTNRVANLLKSGKPDDEMIEELFLSSLSRRPNPEEAEVAKRVIAKDRKIGLEDLQWALLNTTEFLVNH
jgi:hypothetical protein